MKRKFWLCKRGRVFYLCDSETGAGTSLRTCDRAEAQEVVRAKNEAAGKPVLGLALARAYLSAYDPQMLRRTWTDVIEEFCSRGKPQTQSCRRRMTRSKPFDRIRDKLLLETTADDFLAVLRAGGVMTFCFLRCLQNLAVGFGWLPWPVLPPKLWPAMRTKPKRGITKAEHARIIAAEKNIERRNYYELLWETGASQTDAALLCAKNVDWQERLLMYERKKTGEWASLTIGQRLDSLLRQLPAVGLLFPKIAHSTERDRAAEFRRRCRLLGINGVSLHSYRYGWAERAKSCGYPERFAQEALGHNSKAVHRAYARRGKVNVPSLEEYESNGTGIRLASVI